MRSRRSCSPTRCRKPRHFVSFCQKKWKRPPASAKPSRIVGAHGVGPKVVQRLHGRAPESKPIQVWSQTRRLVSHAANRSCSSPCSSFRVSACAAWSPRLHCRRAVPPRSGSNTGRHIWRWMLPSRSYRSCRVAGRSAHPRRRSRRRNSRGQPACALPRACGILTLLGYR